jgi:hypothetical protein
MKRILLLLITLTTFMNVSYASFPITENNTCEVLSATNIEEPDDEDDGHSYWGILGGVLFFGTIYLLVRTIWRGYRRGVPWVKKLLRWRNILWLLLLPPAIIIIGLMGGGFGSGMGG